jgi:hypothetical protein
MSIKRFMNKKVVAIGLAAGITLGGAGAAFAYFTTTGSGSGGTTAGSASAVTLHAAIAGNIVPGDGGQAVTFTADNSNSGAQEVRTISFVSVTSTDTTCNDFLTANTGQFSMTDVTSNTDVPGSSSNVSLNGTGTLVWTDEAYAQNACAGAPLTLNVSSN